MLWTCNNLEKQNVEFIRALPFQESVRFENFDSIRVVHGSTDDIYEHLYPHKVERLREIANSIDEKLILNPGSVGVSFNDCPAAEFSILHWSDNEWKAEHHTVKYDIGRLENEFEVNGLFDKGGIWPYLVVQSLKDGLNRNVEFIKLANRNAYEFGYSSYKYIPNDIWKKTERQWSLMFDKS